MTNPNDHLALAERHVREGEQRVAAQQDLIEKIALDGHDTKDAEKFLETLMQTLALMRQHLQIERTYKVD